jgi:hypothetical protein
MPASWHSLLQEEFMFGETMPDSNSEIWVVYGIL